MQTRTDYKQQTGDTLLRAAGVGPVRKAKSVHKCTAKLSVSSSRFDLIVSCSNSFKNVLALGETCRQQLNQSSFEPKCQIIHILTFHGQPWWQNSWDTTVSEGVLLTPRSFSHPCLSMTKPTEDATVKPVMVQWTHPNSCCWHQIQNKYIFTKPNGVHTSKSLHILLK